MKAVEHRPGGDGEKVFLKLLTTAYLFTSELHLPCSGEGSQARHLEEGLLVTSLTNILDTYTVPRSLSSIPDLNLSLLHLSKSGKRWGI